MFDVLDELETAIDKVAACEREVDVERIVRLSERVEYLKLRTIRDYELSGARQADAIGTAPRPAGIVSWGCGGLCELRAGTTAS